MTKPRTRPRRYTGLVVGPPAPFARTRGTLGGVRYNPAKYTTWKDAAGVIAQGIRRGRPKLEGPVGIELVVTPAGLVFEVWEIAVPETRGTLRGDLDNYAKAIIDALQGVLYENDRQVETITVRFAPDLEEGP
jgi:Holliday junction resolvase RusA-like endonuclease